SNERRLLQERHEGTACGALELLGVKRAIIVGIGSLEAFLRKRKKFILVQGSVIVGIGRREVIGVDPAAQFASVEGTVVIAVKLVEQLRGCTLRFSEIDGAVVVRIQRFLAGSATMPAQCRSARRREWSICSFGCPCSRPPIRWRSHNTLHCRG